MRNNATTLKLAALGLALTLRMTPATAERNLDFDPPTKIVDIPPSSTPSWGDAVTCTYYANAMIRVSSVDTAAPDDAFIVSFMNGKPVPRCRRTAPSQGVELQSDGSNLVGRKGNFLIFRYVDQVSAGDFTIFDMRTGKALFHDGIYLDFISVELDHGVIRLRYNRGINASCSLYADRTGCWAKILATGQIPHDAFKGPPPIGICNKSYDRDLPENQRSPNLDNDPTVVSYDAALTLDGNGHAIVQPVGPLHCDPQS